MYMIELLGRVPIYLIIDALAPWSTSQRGGRHRLDGAAPRVFKWTRQGHEAPARIYTRPT